MTAVLPGSFLALKEALVMADLEIEWAEVEGVTAIIPRRLTLELDTTDCRLLVIALVTCQQPIKTQCQVCVANQSSTSGIYV